MKNASIHLTDPQGRFFLLNRGLGRNNVGEAGRAGAGVGLPTFGCSGRGASQNEAQKGNNINKQGWRTNGRTEGGRAGQGFFTVYARAG